MHTESNILIKRPREVVFEATSDLERWPAILPHYRYVTFLERRPDGGVIKMAAMRDWIPISWTSDLRVDRTNLEIHFHHLKAMTKGMKVVWSYEETPHGTLVRITHDLQFRIPPLRPIAHRIIGGYFIHYVAGKTLATFKEFLESSK